MAGTHIIYLFVEMVVDSFIVASDDPFRWMTFCPEWLTASPNLDTSNPLYLWVYLFVSMAHPYTLRSISHVSLFLIS
jgi:hypothetical protein